MILYFQFVIIMNTTNYYVPYENEDYLIPAERYYKGEIRTNIGGEKDESDIIEAEEFNENDEYNEFEEYPFPQEIIYTKNGLSLNYRVSLVTVNGKIEKDIFLLKD